MQRRSRERSGTPANVQPLYIVIALAVILVALIVALLLLSKKGDNGGSASKPTAGTSTSTTTPINNGPQSLPELVVNSVGEQGEWVVVSTSYCSFRYPTAYSDLIYMEAKMLDGYAVVEFTTYIDGEQYPLYTLLFNGDEGIPLGTLRVGSVRCQVTAVIHKIDAAIPEGWVTTFYAAQETFNDVVFSLEENDGFIPAG